MYLVICLQDLQNVERIRNCGKIDAYDMLFVTGVTWHSRQNLYEKLKYPLSSIFI